MKKLVTVAAVLSALSIGGCAIGYNGKLKTITTKTIACVDGKGDGFIGNILDPIATKKDMRRKNVRCSIVTKGSEVFVVNEPDLHALDVSVDCNRVGFIPVESTFTGWLRSSRNISQLNKYYQAYMTLTAERKNRALASKELARANKEQSIKKKEYKNEQAAFNRYINKTMAKYGATRYTENVVGELTSHRNFDGELIYFNGYYGPIMHVSNDLNSELIVSWDVWPYSGNFAVEKGNGLGTVLTGANIPAGFYIGLHAQKYTTDSGAHVILPMLKKVNLVK